MNTSILEINHMPVGYVKVADCFADRFKGLMMKSEKNTHYVLALSPCKQIHTFFMKFPIDVVFCDEKGCVLEVHRHIEPWKIDKLVSEATVAIEAPAGTFLKNVALGDVINF